MVQSPDAPRIAPPQDAAQDKATTRAASTKGQRRVKGSWKQ